MRVAQYTLYKRVISLIKKFYKEKFTLNFPCDLVIFQLSLFMLKYGHVHRIEVIDKLDKQKNILKIRQKNLQTEKL